MNKDKQKVWDTLSRKPLMYEGIDLSYLYDVVLPEECADTTIEFSFNGQRHRINVKALIEMNK